MKIVWKGKFTNVEQLSAGSLPENAVKFREPETPAKLNIIASLFVIPVLIIIGVAIYIKTQLGASVRFNDILNIWGLLLSYLMIIPHELLHASAFPKEAEVEIWYSLKNMMAFVFSTCPTSKLRFIWLSLLPNLVFGFMPLVIWIFIPVEFVKLNQIVLSFATFSLFMGVGDFLNVFNAATQMPAKSLTQLSGFHSYWYIPKS
jgi:hypothetical protein